MGLTKKSRNYWVAANFNENFVQWIVPKMHISVPCALGVTCFFNIVAPDGGGIIKFLIIKWGGGHRLTKILSRYFWKFMTPHSEENGGPLTDARWPLCPKNYNNFSNIQRPLQTSLGHGTLISPHQYHCSQNKSAPWVLRDKCDTIKQNESEVEKNDFCVFGIFY